MNYTPSQAPAPLKLSIVYSVFMLGLGACQPLVPPTISPPIQNVGQSNQPVSPSSRISPRYHRQTTCTNKNLNKKYNSEPEPNTEPANETITDTAATCHPDSGDGTVKTTRNYRYRPAQLPSQACSGHDRYFGGEADFTRVEGQIGIWQFRQKNCVVDFFFVPPMLMAIQQGSLLSLWMFVAGSSANP